MRRLVSRGLVAAILVLGASAHAQYLQGAAPPSILIEKLDEDARQCGITEDLLDAAVRLPFASANLRINDSALTPYVYVNVNVLRLSSGLCVANVAMDLKRSMWAAPGASRSLIASVWSKGAMLSGGASNFGRRVSDATETFAKQLVGAWLKDN